MANRIKLVFLIALASLGVLVLFACSPIKESTDPKSTLPKESELIHLRSEVSKLIHAMLQDELTPGLSLALVDKSGILWQEGFGLANVDKGILATADTVYRVGSLSKPLTAIAIMQLTRQGLIDLDAPLSDQLPGFAIRNYKKEPVTITPRQLLSHRSGLPGDLHKGMYSKTPFRQVRALLQDEYLAYEPDSVYSYSNLAFDLLGNLIEHKSGESYHQFMAERLFQPLEMLHSGYRLAPQMSARLAAGHKDHQVKPLPPLRDTPALGLYSSAEDLARFSVALLNSDIPWLDHESLKEMWSAQTAEDQIMLGLTPGLGWFIEDDADLGKLVRHGGSMMLFGSEIALLPEMGLGVVVLTNGSGGNRLARQLAATILKLSMGIVSDKPQRRSIRQNPLHAVNQPIPSGGYATDLGLLMIDPKKPKLCVCIIERLLDLVRFEDGSLGLTPESTANLPGAYKVMGKLRFSSQQLEKNDLLVGELNGQELILGKRISDHTWAQAWQELVGPFKTLNPDSVNSIEDMKLSKQAGVFCLHYRMPHQTDKSIRVPLRPVSETEAVIEGYGRGRGVTVRIVEYEGKKCLRFSGYIGEPVTED
jgi:CubicO group peptidase (beta-lactamase class C family)